MRSVVGMVGHLRDDTVILQYFGIILGKCRKFALNQNVDWSC